MPVVSRMFIQSNSQELTGVDSLPTPGEEKRTFRVVNNTGSESRAREVDATLQWDKIHLRQASGRKKKTESMERIFAV